MPVLDLKGLKCPLPVLHTQKALKQMKDGDQIQVIATDPMAEIDIPHFCNQHGHLLLETTRQQDGAVSFLIEKCQTAQN